MSDANLCFWTHAGGPKFGWWGKATHPAHQDPNDPNKLLKSSEWSREMHNCKTLEETMIKLQEAIKDLPV